MKPPFELPEFIKVCLVFSHSAIELTSMNDFVSI